MPIRCEIVSQDRIVYQGDADIVVLPGAGGEMGILPNHSPLLSVLQFGCRARAVQRGRTVFHGCRWGG
jgi:F-type H+-transporting ATPase subunit epsilon